MRRAVVRSMTDLRFADRLGLALLALFFVLPAVSRAEPVLFPATEAGWPSQILDSRNVSPYLAFHKAEHLKRIQGVLGQARQTGNEDSYDARFYDLNLTLDPTNHLLTGIVQARATVVSGPLSTMDLDMEGDLTVDGVTAGGHPATYTHANSILTVNLDRSYANGELMTVVVRYHGDPSQSPDGAWGWDSSGGHPMVWTLSEPFGARSWWPCKDWSEDKADSVNVTVTAPTGMITASEGRLISHTDDGIHSVYRWQERHPISTYLVSLASYPYTVYSDYYHYAPTDSMEIKFFIFPSDVQAYRAANAMVKTMIGTYAGLFGQYPFLDEKYGMAEFLWGGGMEHQTCTSLGQGAFVEWIIAHELSHQWWGDMITCKDFHHVWLNEGFATYCESLWDEQTYGEAAYFQNMDGKKFFGPGTIYVDNLNDFNRIFDSNLSYNKASWVLHMLRHVVGDSTFFACLRGYRQQYQYSVATTENFRDVCEGVSGKNLYNFFQDWIYGQYYPAYKYDWSASQGGGGYDLTLNLQQTQTTGLFHMPVDVVITTQNGQQTTVVNDSLATQQFVIHLTDNPVTVALDPNDWILKTVDEPVENPALDRGVLVVNAVDWGTYGSEITSAYQDKAFWGDYPIDFWDVFPPPSGGYPPTLPPPLGHGSVPADVIGHYRNVIWVGNDYNGDLDAWMNSPIMGYVGAGGNLILMTRMGDQYLTASEQAYLGLQGVTGSNTLYDCVSTYLGLSPIGLQGSQTMNATFNMTFSQPDSRLIYKVHQNYNPERGIGVWRKPAGGGTYRPTGAQFVFLSGRPYRWNHTDLKTNIMYMLRHFFNEPLSPAGAQDVAAASFRLDPPEPNPLHSSASVRFALPATGDVRLDLLDVSGRKVREIAGGAMGAGAHVVAWDGRDGDGHAVAAGVYWLRLRAQGNELTQKLTVVR